MRITDLLKEKVDCYTTEKSKDCNYKLCKFYYTCIASKTMIDNGETTRKIVLSNKECR